MILIAMRGPRGRKTPSDAPKERPGYVVPDLSFAVEEAGFQDREKRIDKKWPPSDHYRYLPSTRQEVVVSKTWVTE
jgi:hypothetical protein